MSNSDGSVVRRVVGWVLPRATATILCVIPWRVAAAQVGHDPATSPFRDVTTRQGLTVQTGWFSGNEGNAGVGARAGTMVTLRFQSRLSGPLDLLVSIGGINTTRYIVNPDSPLATRTTGPVNHDLIAADLALGFNLSGQKTWRGLAPFVALGVGMLMPTRGTTDPGGYEARQNFSFVPTIGARLAITPTLSLQGELRDYLFRYEWPLAYFEPSNPAVRATPVLVSGEDAEKDWTSNLALTFGLSWRFNF